MKGYDEVLKEIQSRLDTQAPEARLLVRIGGKSCSGKSYISAAIQKAFASVTIINLDNYTKGKQELTSELPEDNVVINWDEPHCIDLDAAAQDLRRVLAGEVVQGVVFDYSTDPSHPSQKVALIPAKIIIIEGIFALDHKLMMANPVDIYSHHSNFSCLVRRLIRSREFTPAVDFEYMLKIGLPMGVKNIESKVEAHQKVIQNEYDPGIEAQRCGLISFIAGLPKDSLPLHYDTSKNVKMTRLFFAPRGTQYDSDIQKICVTHVGEMYYFNYIFLAPLSNELPVWNSAQKLYKVSFAISPLLLGMIAEYFMYISQQVSNVLVTVEEDALITYRSQQVEIVNGVQSIKEPEVEVDLRAAMWVNADYRMMISNKIQQMFFTNKVPASMGANDDRKDQSVLVSTFKK